MSSLLRFLRHTIPILQKLTGNMCVHARERETEGRGKGGGGAS
jgi:hypothetical protein